MSIKKLLYIGLILFFPSLVFSYTQTIISTPSGTLDFRSGGSFEISTIHQVIGTIGSTSTNPVNTFNSAMYYDSSVLTFNGFTKEYNFFTSVPGSNLSENSPSLNGDEGDADTDRAVFKSVASASGDLCNAEGPTAFRDDSTIQAIFGSDYYFWYTDTNFTTQIDPTGGFDSSGGAFGGSFDNMGYFQTEPTPDASVCNANIASRTFVIYIASFTWRSDADKSVTKLNFDVIGVSTNNNSIGVGVTGTLLTIQGPLLAPVPANSSLTPFASNATTTTAGTSIDFVIDLRDQNGDEADQNSLRLVGFDSGSYTISNNGATYTITYTTTTTVTSDEIGVYVDTGQIGTTQTITVNADTLNVANSPIDPNTAQTINAGGYATFTITAQDQFGNPITISSSSASGNRAGVSTLAIAAIASTNAIITYTATQTTTGSGENTLIATLNGTTFNLPAITVNSDVFNAAISVVDVGTPLSVTADEQVTFTITLKDQYGNNLTTPSAITSAVTSTFGNITFGTNPAAVVNATYAVNALGTGTDAVGFFANSTLITGGAGPTNITVSSGAPSIANGSDPSSITLSNNGATVPVGSEVGVTITVKDQFGNPVSTIPTIELSSSATTGAITEVPPGSGVYVLSVSSTVGGNITVTATIDSVVFVRTINFNSLPVLTLGETNITLTENTPDTIRRLVTITLSDVDNEINTFGIDFDSALFTSNPAPVASFATDSIITSQQLSSSDAYLYFTIIPDTIGTGAITITLTDSNNNSVIKTITVNISEANNDPVITDEFDSRLLNISVFGGNIYANSAAGGSNVGSARSVFTPVADELNGHLFIENSAEENTFFEDNVLSTGGRWFGYLTNKAANSFPFNILQVTNSSTQLYAQVTGNGVYDLLPGMYDRSWNNDGSNIQPSSQFTDDDIAGVMDRFVLRQNNTGFGTRHGIYEFPNGFTETANLAGTSLTQGDNSTQIATLSGFDLDGDTITWTAEVSDSNAGGAITFDTQPTGATGTTNVNYAPASTTFGTAYATITLTDSNNNTDTVAISITINTPAADATQSSVTLGNTDAIAGTDAVLTITIRGGVSGVKTAQGTITFNLVSANGTPVASLANVSTGVYTLSVSHTIAENVSVDVYVDGALIEATRTISFDESHPNTIVLALSANTVISNTNPVTLYATITDVHNNFIPSGNVSLAVGNIQGNTSIAIANSLSIINGIATTDITSSSTNSGSVTITATVTSPTSTVNVVASAILNVQVFGFTTQAINMISGDSILLSPTNASNTTTWSLAGTGTFSVTTGTQSIYSARTETGATMTINKVVATNQETNIASTLTITTYNPVAISLSSNNIVRGDTGTASAIGGDESYIFSSTNANITVGNSDGIINTTNSSEGDTTTISVTDGIDYAGTTLSATKSNSATSEQISITADAPSAVTSTVSGNDTPMSENADNNTEFFVQLKDRNSNNVGGSITTSAPSLGNASIAIASNTLTGVATITYTPGLVGTETIVVYINGVAIATRTIVVTHGALTSVVLSPANSVVLVLQATDATLTATLRDQRTNLVTTSGNINFSTNGTGTTLTIKSSDTTTSNGLATLVVTSSPTVEGEVIITAVATVSGVSLSDSTTITAQAFGFSSIDDLLLIIGGSATTALTVNGGGANVEIAVISGAGSLSTTTGTSTIYSTTVAGTALITATDTIGGNLVSNSVVITTILISAPSIADINKKSYVVGSSISPLTFANIASYPATPTACTVSPALPAGLSIAISDDDCAITGTPSVMSAVANYTIVASNASGSDSANVTISAIVIDTTIDYALLSQGASGIVNSISTNSCQGSTADVSRLLNGDNGNLCYGGTNNFSERVFTIDLGQDRMISAVQTIANGNPNVSVELKDNAGNTIESKTTSGVTVTTIDNSTSGVRTLVFRVTHSGVNYQLYEFIARPAVQPITVSNIDGSSIAVNNTVDSGQSLSFVVTGGAVNNTVTADKGIFSQTLGEVDGVYTFTAPTTGAFAGTYTISITAVGGVSVDYYVTVPPILSIISNQGNTNLLGTTGAATATISGLSISAGDTVFTASFASLTIGIVNAPIGATTQTVSISSEVNEAVDFTLYAKAADNATVTTTGRVLESITYNGTVNSDNSVSALSGAVVNIVNYSATQTSDTNGEFSFIIAKLANNILHKFNIRADGHVQQQEFQPSSTTFAITLVEITNPATITIAVTPATALLSAIDSSGNNSYNFIGNSLQVNTTASGATYTVYAQADGYFNSSVDVFVDTNTNNVNQSITLTPLPAQANSVVTTTLGDEVGGIQQVASNTFGLDDGFELVFNTRAQDINTRVLQDKVVEQIDLKLPPQALDFNSASVIEASITKVEVSVIPINTSNTITNESELTVGISYQVDIITTTDDGATMLIDTLNKPLVITIGYDTGIASAGQLVANYVIFHKTNEGVARPNITITADNIDEERGLITFKVTELSIFSIGSLAAAGTIFTSSSGGGGCSLVKNSNYAFDPMLILLILLSVAYLYRRRTDKACSTL